MQTTDGFDGLRCLDCGERFAVDADAGRCPDCGGALEATYDSEALADAHAGLFDGAARGVSAVAAVLPFPASAIPIVMQRG